ncbi:uncharacterized protein LOC122042801 [Zingiber officinale]|uniref:FCP1 homology domain-containing protein n=1 Tax=Zingiber officinale TaxID=94328 RepID=A0A8J5HRT3_ZINOF|nr:uncharacterized protein LOC122042801 [Zingiber officinale]XP_042459048.1 uncharacterized protein LOC122042801 [Zingiber officinale]KAG6529868.1 hypothetical protein ZIOFF_012083 [Zingiber officinale]
MPAFRIKSKSNTERLYDLHTSRKSVKISKSSEKQFKALQQGAQLDTFSQTHHDASINVEVSICKSTTAELNGTSIQSLKPSFLSDPGSMTKQDSGLPDVEAISPNLEDGLSQMKSLNHSGQDKYECSRLPHLVADESEDGIFVTDEYQTCILSNFYDSDSLYTLPFDSSIGVVDVLNSTFPIYEFMNSDIMIDMVGGCMIVPSPYRTVETGSIHETESVQENMNFDEACLYLATHPENELTCDFGNLEEIDYCNQQLPLKTLTCLPEAVSSILLPPEAQNKRQVTLVLDLDETLVHSTMEHCDDADFTFPIFFDMKHHTVYVRRRPFLQLFLERVAQMFKIIIFTASQSIYAEKLLDILDPDRNIISKRVYRESCVFSDGNYTKDLTILGIDLAKVAIVDNTPQVFRLQVNNGIPIKSWFGDPFDEALIQLLLFLETLVDVDDVRPIIAKQLSNKE